MDIARIFYRCKEAIISLLELLLYFYDDPEQPLLPSRSTSGHQEPEESHLLIVNEEHGPPIQQWNDNEQPDLPLSPLLLPFDGRNGQSNFLSLNIGNVQSPIPEFNDMYQTGVYLNHVVQSPIPGSSTDVSTTLSPPFIFSSLLVPPTNNITDFSTEILLEIFSYLAVVDANDEETASPLVLQCIRLVCRHWRAIVDNHCCGRFLTATPGFLVQDCEDRVENGGRPFDALCKINETGPALDTVSFHLCDRFASPGYTLNVEHARIFTGALMKCKTARIVIDLTEAELSEDAFTRTTLPLIPLQDFSWTSEHMGIRHILPEVYRFPWLTLRHDLPWHQLTHVDLNCPLSLRDAHYILAYGICLTTARLATLKCVDDLIEGSFPCSRPTATSLLRSLTIYSQLDLHQLFSNLEVPQLTYLSLSVVHPHSYLGLIFQGSGSTLDPSLNVPWAQIEELNIRYQSGQICDVAPILSNCYRLRRLSLAGDLIIGTITNFVPCLDNATLDAGILWYEPSMSLKETTIKKLQITQASSHEQLQYLLSLKAVNELSIVDPIDLTLLLAILTSVPSLGVGKFNISSISSKATTDPIVFALNLRRLDVTTSKGLIQLVSAILKSRMDPTSVGSTDIMSVHE